MKVLNLESVAVPKNGDLVVKVFFTLFDEGFSLLMADEEPRKVVKCYEDGNVVCHKLVTIQHVVKCHNPCTDNLVEYAETPFEEKMTINQLRSQMDPRGLFFTGCAWVVQTDKNIEWTLSEIRRDVVELILLNNRHLKTLQRKQKRLLAEVNQQIESESE